MQKFLAQFGRDRRLSTAWGRIFFQFGPYEHPDRLVPSVIRHLLRESRSALCTHGQADPQLSACGRCRRRVCAACSTATFKGPVNIGSGERIAIGGFDRAHRARNRASRPGAARRPQRPSESRRCWFPMCAACARSCSGGRSFLDRGHSRCNRLVARPTRRIGALHEPLPGWHPLVGAFPDRAGSLGDGAAAGGALVRDESRAATARNSGHLEPVSRCGGRLVCLGQRTWRGAGSGCERRGARRPSRCTSSGRCSTTLLLVLLALWRGAGTARDRDLRGSSCWCCRGQRCADRNVLPWRQKCLSSIGVGVRKIAARSVEAPRGDQIDASWPYCAGVLPVKYVIT